MILALTDDASFKNMLVFDTFNSSQGSFWFVELDSKSVNKDGPFSPKHTLQL